MAKKLLNSKKASDKNSFNNLSINSCAKIYKLFQNKKLIYNFNMITKLIKFTKFKLFEQYLLEYVEKDFYSMSDEYQEILENITRYLFQQIQNQIPIKFKTIPNIQYHNALKEFMRYGQFMRFPTKYIYQWKSRTMENIAKLWSLTQIHGHSQNFPYDEFLDIFDYNQEDWDDEGGSGEQYNGEYTKWLKKIKKIKSPTYQDKTDFYNCYDFLDEVKNLNNITPQFTNGHQVLSDYATNPLLDLMEELDDKESPEEIIVVLNKILDVTHQRSDIAELFIKGGSSSLDDIFYDALEKH